MYDYAVGERAPWGNFPPVIRNAEFGASRKETEYVKAKQGSDISALILVDRMFSLDVLDETFSKYENIRPTLLPLLSDEQNGRDRIPLAMACVLADRFGWDVEFGIVQQEQIHRTGAGPSHRIAFTPRFEGEVEKGRSYLIVDDTVIFGGTIASLRGYVENRGGNAVAAMVLTGHDDSINLPISRKMTENLQMKHGPELNNYFKENFGYGIDKFTNGEASYLLQAPSIDAIRDRITSTRDKGIRYMDVDRTSSAPNNAVPVPKKISEVEKSAPEPSMGPSL